MSVILTQSRHLQFAAPAAAVRVALEAEDDFSSTGIFRCYADCEAVVLASLTAPLRLLGRNIQETVTDYLEFALTARAALSRPQAGAAATRWVGKECGEIAVRGGEAVTPTPVLGVAEVIYPTHYSRWQLPVASLSLPRVLVVAVCREELARLGFSPARLRRPGGGGGTDSLPWTEHPPAARLTYGNPASAAPSEPQPTRYVLTVVDHCTGDPVPGATVSTSFGRGVADANGQLEIGPVPPGARVQVHITAPGYQDTRLDSLNNDYFIA